MLNDLKPYPFCGEEVAFSFDMKPYNRAYEGRCIGCGMEFRYQERITIYQKKYLICKVNHLLKLGMRGYKK